MDIRRISVRHEHVTQLPRTTGLDSAANQMLYIYICIYVRVSRKAYANKYLKIACGKRWLTTKKLEVLDCQTNPHILAIRIWCWFISCKRLEFSNELGDKIPRPYRKLTKRSTMSVVFSILSIRIHFQTFPYMFIKKHVNYTCFIFLEFLFVEFQLFIPRQISKFSGFFHSFVEAIFRGFQAQRLQHEEELRSQKRGLRFWWASHSKWLLGGDWNHGIL